MSRLKSAVAAGAVAVGILNAPASHAQQTSGHPGDQQGATQADAAAANIRRKVIYRASGVRDNGGAPDTGIATVFICSSYANAKENLKIKVFNFENRGGEQVVTFEPHGNFVFSTKMTNLYPNGGIVKPTTIINPGQAVISATSNKITCTAMVIDASASVPNGIALQMTRFYPTFP